jgi:hypothetical protein
MGLTTKLRDMLGIGDLVRILEQDRQMQHEMLQQVIRISALQAETATRMVGTLETMLTAYAVDGPPEGRHMTEELEVEILEQVMGHGRES